ncbi:MAG: YybH family protein [Anaerolineae bacterium]
MKRAVFLSLILLLVAACGPTAAPATPSGPSPRGTDTPTPASDEEAILQLLAAEAEGVVQQDIDRLMDLWAPDGVVTDANHTPDDPSDDLVWEGAEAIKERYLVIFQSFPTQATHPDVELTISGDTAEATTTTTIGVDMAPKGDKWTFAKIEGRWYITSLTFNLEEE